MATNGGAGALDWTWQQAALAAAIAALALFDLAAGIDVLSVGVRLTAQRSREVDSHSASSVSADPHTAEQT